MTDIPLLAQQGFLPTRGSFMLDFVVLAMFGVLAIMTVSIGLVRFRQMYQLHKQIQITLAVVLLITIVAFEVDLRLITKDWRQLAQPSAYFESGAVDISLWIHLVFAIPTPFVWGFVIVQAIRRFPSPVKPNEYSARHKIWARIAAFFMFATAITGWIFYTLAFVL